MASKKKEEKTRSKSAAQSTKKKGAARPGGPSTPSQEELILALSSEDDKVRVKARSSLVALGKAAVPLLAKALKETDNLVRWEAAKALGEIGVSEAGPLLVEALEDEQFDVRWLAAVGLINMNIKGLKPLLHALMERTESVPLRDGAHHVIHDLTKGELKKYLAPVLSCLESAEPTAECPRVVFHTLEMLEMDKKISDTWTH